jgi:formylglycine-generating enzyme required for sulfatase activity
MKPRPWIVLLLALPAAVLVLALASRADLCRSACRNEEDPGYTDTCFGRDIHGFVGFRCVRRPAPERGS